MSVAARSGDAGHPRRLPPFDTRLLVALYALEVAALLTLLALNRYYNRLGALTVRQSIVLLVPIALCLISGGYAALRHGRSRKADPRRFTFTLATNIVAVLLALGAGELAVRTFSVRTPVGLSFAGTTLLPRNWQAVKTRNAEILARAPAAVSYLVADDFLGWVPGPNRRSADGLYATSAEGIRSARPGIAYAATSAADRVAIVGDSFTFGLEVAFEDSWGSVLGRALGADVVVLNFGVNGYGVDQSYLRYERDARPLRPDVTIFGFIDDDLYRTESVYSFVTFPEWDLIFAKPHFVMKAGRLERVNDDLPSPTEILGVASVADLPFIAHDSGYNPDEWTAHFYDRSVLLRFLLSRFARWPPPAAAERHSQTTRINVELVRSFFRRATSDGSVPVVVYLPSRGDFTGQDRSAKDSALAELGRAGVGYLDLTSCIGEIGEDRAFLADRPHYSPEGNAAVARCLLPIVRDHLSR